MTKKHLPLTLLIVFIVSLVLFLSWHKTYASNFPPQTSDGSIGLQGTISTAPPSKGATITTPVNGAVFSSLPITVNGLCPDNLLVKLFSNNVFIGSTQCTNNSFSLQVDLFPLQNELIARVYDSLDQAGPDSNTVTVTFNDAQTVQFGSRVVLTSSFAREGVNPGSVLTWPIIISGGNSPYAVSVDWGDGSPSTLLSEASPGTFNIVHTYKNSGVYNVVIKATDTNKTEAFLQLVAVSNGAAQSNSSSNANNTSLKVEVEWWPAVAMLPLVFASFWIGQRHELYTLRKQLERNRQDKPE